MQFINKKGILFWITGLSGAGKTSVANEIKNEITKQFGPTLVFNGDDLRKKNHRTIFIFSWRKIILKKKFKYFFQLFFQNHANPIRGSPIHTVERAEITLCRTCRTSLTR